MMKIRESLLQYRYDNNLTSIQLADKIGVSDRALRRWISGEREPSLKCVKMIIDNLDVQDIYGFVFGEKKTEKDTISIPKLMYIP